MEPLTGLWADLKKAGGLPTKGVLLSTCEAELTQLMQQIDVMVQAKRSEWNQERQVLNAKLDVREQEHTLTKSTLDKKHQEIGQLRCQIETTDRDKRAVVEQYEKQLKLLKEEVGTMRKEYERLKKQYRRYAHQEKHKAATDIEESSGELRKLSKKLDDYRQRAKDWEQQKRSLQKQVEGLESQRKTYADKCDLMQQQSSGYQSQLDKRRDMLDSAELTLRSQITQLEGQLQRARDTINAQDSQLTHLKTTLEDAVTSQRRTLEEKEQTEDTLERAHNKVRTLETELERCQSELEAQNAHVKVISSTNEQLMRDKTRLEKVVAEKDSAMHKIKLKVQHEQTKLITKLHNEIEILLDENQKSRKAERFFRDETGELREKLESSRKDCETLNEQMAVKIREIRLLDGNHLWAYKARRLQLEEKLSHLRMTHEQEMDRLQRELADLTADLHKRNLALAALSEKSTGMEQTVRDQEEHLDRKSAEVQVASAQLEALRVESRHLRKTALRSSSNTEEAEGQLRELQSAYTSSLKALEQQNEALQLEVQALREHSQQLQDSTEGRVESALQETEKTLDKVKDAERRRVEDSRKAAESRASDLEMKLDMVTEQYEAQISHHRDEINNLKDDLDYRNKTLKRLGMEHNAMTHFVGGVEEVVHRQPRREMSILLNTSQRSVSPGPGGYIPERDEDENIDDIILDPVDMVTEQFLSQQQERTKELERKLDQHIEGLKVSMDVTNRKYLNER